MAIGQSSNTFQTITFSVTAPGTAERVSAFYVPEGGIVSVTSRRSNSGNFYLAETAAKAQSGARKVLVPGQSREYRLTNTAQLFVDADSASDVLEVSIEGQTAGTNPA